jgi:hypothetical protein
VKYSRALLKTIKHTLMKYLSLILIVAFATSSFAQKVDSIRVGEPFKAFDQLNFETYEFEVFTVRNGKKSVPIRMKSSTKPIEIDGQEYVNISHEWNNPQMSGSFSALVEPHTLKPISQIRHSQKGKEAYRFYDDKIIGLDSAADNVAADYIQALSEPVFNFEIDLETYSILPFEAGKTIYMPFHHAGSHYTEPGWYKYTVSSEQINVDGLGEVATWVLHTDYKGTQPTKFWYTKKDRKFIKMEADYKGMKIY